METDRAGNEQELENTIQESRAVLEVLRADNQTEQHKMRVDLAEQKIKPEQETRKTVGALHDKKVKERHLNATEQRRLADATATVQQRQEILVSQLQACSTCMDEEAKLIGGCFCINAGEGHFTCDACFTSYVKTKMEEDLRLLEANDAAVFCPCKTPQLGCDSPAVADEYLFRHAPEVFRVVLAARQRSLEKQLTQRVRREERTRMEEEKVRLAQLSAQERKVYGARKIIVEDLLTLKCPSRDCG
jgi:hypothetical protein